jgi:hypothetical protein
VSAEADALMAEDGVIALEAAEEDAASVTVEEPDVK